jgi:hypothetical protein
LFFSKLCRTVELIGWYFVNSLYFFSGAAGVQAWNCSADMSFLWFRQISGTTLRFCIGTEIRSSDCSDTSTDTFYSISSKFVKVTMMGLFADADFHWGKSVIMPIILG